MSWEDGEESLVMIKTSTSLGELQAQFMEPSQRSQMNKSLAG
jgi:hypothetical protein